MAIPIKKPCYNCSGTGTVQDTELPCTVCNETGFIAESYLADSLSGRISTVYPTYAVIESTSASEFNALSDANKDAYRQILSCGTIDLADGTNVRTKLWNMFDSESETRAALIELLGE